ncbi:ABC transporter ATP-binding protein [Leucobacter rhizosphaerae]|uniref:ABC transporter ATP-binding protein n=1 Tax=Leucobacter rhizosphaerae TaxID=2932245 RepID=A0ABY4FTG0_9MICO|nr:ABC transporter ATP-binding protein [Leucobacter rhizosphaerae]UOQ59542.1 ABC transporter ATP-binding protein [Leucobacter rhizosphaerae]
MMRATPVPASSEEALLRVENLTISFSSDPNAAPAVLGADLEVRRGEVVAIVGESGSGKTTLAMSVLGLLAGNARITTGSIGFGGADLLTQSPKQRAAIRGSRVGLVPQDPMSNLNPMMRIGDQLGEVLLRHGRATRQNVVRECCRVLERAGIPDPESRLRQFPHQLSGGLRQRVLIAIGTACDPELLIADEPTSALDVTVAARILDQIAEISSKTGMAVLLITHDLGLAAERADRVVVMQHGRVVEAGPAAQILEHPEHPYSRQLVAADPGVRARSGTSRIRHRDVDATDCIVEVRGVSKTYQRKRRDTPVHANREVSLKVPRGSTVAIVGESGSGKTTISRMMLKLETPSSGSMLFEGNEIATLDRQKTAEFRKRVQPVFQDPYSSLNPMMTVRAIVREGLDHYRIGTRDERERKTDELLEQVGLSAEMGRRHPAQLSGGQRQRVAIARAVSMDPELLVCDEPVSALDVLVQQQVLDLLRDMQEQKGLTYVVITHDLAVVREFADYVYVMRDGSIVEAAETARLFEAPQEEYTRQLLTAAGVG